MKIFFMLVFCTLSSYMVMAQNTFRAKAINDQTKAVLKGATATIPALKIAVSADTSGLITIPNIPNGKFEIEITYVSFSKSEKVYSFPQNNPDEIIDINLEPTTGELAEVTIQTTRTNQNLRDIPTRVEALPLEELDEKSTMRPGDI